MNVIRLNAIKPLMKRLTTTKLMQAPLPAGKISPGDKVLVFRRATPDEESQWPDAWTEEMDRAIGKVGTVSYRSGLKDWCLTFAEDHVWDGYHYPEFCLKKVS